MDTALQQLESENLHLHTKLQALKSDPAVKGDTSTNVILRGLQSRLLVLAEEKSRLGEECVRLAEENRSLQVVLASEGDVSELRNKAGEIERMIEKFRSEQVGLQKVTKGQASMLATLEAKERAHNSELAVIKRDIQQAKDQLAALSQDDQDAGEIRKFEKLLRAEQETGLALSRQLQAIKARATDTTNKFMLQRRLAERQRDWALEKPVLEERIAALQRKANALVAEGSTTLRDVPAVDEATQKHIASLQAKLLRINSEIEESYKRSEAFRAQADTTRSQLREAGLFVTDGAPGPISTARGPGSPRGGGSSPRGRASELPPKGGASPRGAKRTAHSAAPKPSAPVEGSAGGVRGAYSGRPTRLVPATAR